MTISPYLKRCLRNRQTKTKNWARGNNMIKWDEVVQHKEDDVALWADMGLGEMVFNAKNLRRR